jgi:hypothetical protein
MRLREFGQKYYRKAMDGDGDQGTGILYIKASERLATLLRTKAPLGHAVQLIHQTAPVRQLNSTGETRAVLDHVLHISLREREPLTPRLELPSPLRQ